MEHKSYSISRVWVVPGFGDLLPLLLPLHPQEYPLAALAGTACHCGFPTTRFPLHEREDEQLCAQKCSAEEFESCGTPSYFIVYQTQVQGKASPHPTQQTPRSSPDGHPEMLQPVHSIQAVSKRNCAGQRAEGKGRARERGQT